MLSVGLTFSQISLILLFVIFALFTIICSKYVAIYAEILSSKISINTGIIGLILLASITSLPELSVSLSAITNHPLDIGPDLAIGNMLGSNLFNLLILGLLGIIFTNKFAELKNIYFNKYIIQSLILLALVWLIFISVNEKFNTSILAHKFFIILIPLLYIIFMILNKDDFDNQNNSANKSELSNKVSLFYFKFLILIFLVILGGVILTFLSSKMALPFNEGGLGLSSNLIGTLFLALSTSLPELALAYSCLKINQINMALGNIFGSNLFNLLIIFIGDIALKKEPLLKYISNNFNITFLSIFLLSLLSLLIVNSNKTKIIKFYCSVVIVVYIFSIFLIS